MISICSNTDGIHFDHLIKVVTARILHSIATLLLPVNNMYFGREIFENMYIFNLFIE